MAESRRPLMAGPWLEAVLAFLLLSLHLTASASMPGSTVESLLFGLAACAGAALSGAYPLAGAGACLMGLLGFLTLPSADAGPAIYSGLIVIFACMSRRLVRLALITAAGYLAFAGALMSVESRGAELATYMLVWAVLCGLAWLLGVSIRASRDDERHLAEKSLEAQRQQMAAELHDNVAHDLALIIMRTEERNLAQKTADPDMEFIAVTARRAVTHLRGMMRLMRLGDPVDEVRLLLGPVLEDVVEGLRSAGFQASLMAQGDVGTVPLAVQDTLARVSKEAANNITKYASRDMPCSVLVDVSASAVDLAFANGIGSGQGPSSGSGLGLVGVRERVEAVGGVVEAGLRGSQWVMRVSVPLQA